MTEQQNDEQELAKLERLIQKAQSQGQPIDKYVLREIQILQNTLKLFLDQMKSEDRLNDVQVAEIEIRQYAAMKQLAQKINRPYAIFDEKIKQVQIRIFGEEGYKQFFENENE